MTSYAIAELDQCNFSQHAVYVISGVCFSHSTINLVLNRNCLFPLPYIQRRIITLHYITHLIPSSHLVFSSSRAGLQSRVHSSNESPLSQYITKVPMTAIDAPKASHQAIGTPMKIYRNTIAHGT